MNKFEQVKKLLEEGKITEAEALMDEIEVENKAVFERNEEAKVENKALENTNIEEVIDLKKVEEVKDVKVSNYEEVFAKVLMGRELDPADKVEFEKVNNAAYTHQAANQPILIPEITMSGILKMVEEQHPFYGEIRKLNVRGNLTIKQHTGVVAGDAAFVDEGTKATDEENAFAEINLTGFELAKLVRVSFKLEAMSIPEFLEFIKYEIADRVGRALGSAVFNGTGVKEPKGLLTVLAEQSGTPQIVEGPATYENMTKLRSLIVSQFAPGAKFYARGTTIWNELANVLDGNKRPIFIRDVVDGGVGTIFGVPVIEDDGVPADSVVLGNASAGMLQNTNEPFSIQTERSVVDRETRYQGYTIVDFGVTYTQAFGQLKIVEGEVTP